MKKSLIPILLIFTFIAAACSKSQPPENDPLKAERDQKFNAFLQLQMGRSVQKLIDQGMIGPERTLQSTDWTKPYPCAEGGTAKVKYAEFKFVDGKLSDKVEKNLDSFFEFDKCADLDVVISGKLHFKSNELHLFKSRDEVISLDKQILLDGELEFTWKDSSSVSHNDRMKYENVSSVTNIRGSRVEFLNQLIRRFQEKKDPADQKEMQNLMQQGTKCSGTVTLNGRSIEANCSLNL